MTKDILVIGSQEIFHGIRDCLKDDNTIKIYYTGILKVINWEFQFHNYCLIVIELIECKDISYQTIIKIRECTPIPILVVVEKSSISDKVLMLKSGADDVLEKTFVMEECIARMKALMRRYTELNHIVQNNGDIISYNKLLIDTGRRCISIDGKEISVPRKEYDILLYMLKNRWHILTYEQIYEAVWKDVYLGDRSIIFYHIGKLRKKIGNGWIESVRGIGYRFCNKVNNEKDISDKP